MCECDPVCHLMCLQWVYTACKRSEISSSHYGNIICLLTCLKVLYWSLHTSVTESGTHTSLSFLALLSLEQLRQSTHECLKSITHDHYWQSILELLTSADASCRHKLDPTIAEFFSLTVELFRHKEYQVCSIDSRTVSENTPFRCIVTSLLRLLSLVEGCGNVFVLKRFIDVALKAESEACSMEIVHFIAPALKSLLCLPVCKKILDCWMELYAAAVLPESVIPPLAKRSCLENETHQNELVAIFVRKTILLVMKCIARLLINLSQYPPQPTSGNWPSSMLLDIVSC